MTDNTNIEAEEIHAFMAQYRKEHPESAEYSNEKIQYNLDRGWILGWRMARRAALSNAGPLRNKDGEILWEYSHSAGGLVPATRDENCKAEPVVYIWQHDETGNKGFIDVQQIEWGFEKQNPRLKVIGPIFLHPSVPAPLNDARIKEVIEGIKCGDGWDGERWDMEIARAIEQAHGINALK